MILKNKTYIELLRFKKSNSLIFWSLIIYLVFIAIYFIVFMVCYADYDKAMPLNEIGDFFAGVFSPLAFLFLFLGYIQQSKAIKQTNENIDRQLELQARMLTLHEQERIQQEHAAQPIIELTVTASKSPKIVSVGNGNFEPLPNTEGIRFDFIIHNKGEKISEVIISLTGDIQEILQVQSSINKDQILETATLLTKPRIDSYTNENISFALNIHYRTSLGIRYLRKYNVMQSIRFKELSYDYDTDYEKLP